MVGDKFAPPTIQTSLKSAVLWSYIFVSFRQITFKHGNLTDVKGLFSAVLESVSFDNEYENESISYSYSLSFL